jgi:hypothetical protein
MEYINYKSVNYLLNYRNKAIDVFCLIDNDSDKILHKSAGEFQYFITVLEDIQDKLRDSD